MSALQKYLEKSGMNLSYMKNAIRAARAAGTPILRNEAQVMEHLNKTEPSWRKKFHLLEKICIIKICRKPQIC